MVGNDLLMQFQADILGVPVVRPRVAETTALGAAYAAGLAVGFWARPGRVYGVTGRPTGAGSPAATSARERRYRDWKRAVERTLEWVEEEAE